MDRVVDVVRRWRQRTGSPDLITGADLSDDADLHRLRSCIDDCIAGRGGEVAARRRAGDIGTAFLGLDQTGRQRFFELLANEYGHDDAEVDTAMAAVTAADPGDARRAAENELRRALRPRRAELVRRFTGLEGGLAFAIELREALLPLRTRSTALRQLDDEFRVQLEAWFDVALLELRQLTWDSPASLLEKLIEYEAVHAIESWDDLRGRLGPGRRCWAFTHPAMPGEPIIFVEVALTKGMASSIHTVLDHRLDRTPTTDADTANFYSISNCHTGLAGVSLGNLLIKQVVEQLNAELPGVDTFVTLSPIPGLRAWIEQHHPDTAALLTDTVPATAVPDERSAPARAHRDRLLSLAKSYLVEARRPDGRALDPVAHFHLSNGASIERLDWWANPSDIGWSRSYGIMVNYRYDLATIEANHDRYDADRSVASSLS